MEYETILQKMEIISLVTMQSFYMNTIVPNVSELLVLEGSLFDSALKMATL